MRTVVFRSQYHRYTLHHDAVTDEYFLDVLCGTVVLNDVLVKLSPDQVRAYRSDGRPVLDDISRKVRDDELARQFGDLGQRVESDRKRQWWGLVR